VFTCDSKDINKSNISSPIQDRIDAKTIIYVDVARLYRCQNCDFLSMHNVVSVSKLRSLVYVSSKAISMGKLCSLANAQGYI
jgi:hypothetical protein